MEKDAINANSIFATNEAWKLDTGAILLNSSGSTSSVDQAIEITKTNRKDTSLTIQKNKYSDKDAPIQGVKVKILVNVKETNSKLGATENTWGWLKEDGTIAPQTTAIENVYEYTTDEDGKIAIGNIPYGDYYIYETFAPAKYPLSAQENYKQAKPAGYTGTFFSDSQEWVGLGEKTISITARDQTLQATNKETINIEGYVWEDTLQGKPPVRNNRRDSNDNRIAGVKVRLKDRTTGSSIINNNGKDYVETDSNGAYKIEKIDASALTNCYVEFDYSNVPTVNDSSITYKSYVPVQFNDKVCLSLNIFSVSL